MSIVQFPEGIEMSTSEEKSNSQSNWIELAKIAQQSFFNRRSLEWKLALGFWTAIGAFTALIVTEESIAVSPQEVKYAYLIVLIIAIVCWKVPIQLAHAGDKAFFLYYLKRSQKCDCKDPKTELELLESTAAGKRCSWLRKKYFLLKIYMRPIGWFWLLGQILFSAMFLVGSYELISQDYALFKHGNEVKAETISKRPDGNSNLDSAK